MSTPPEEEPEQPPIVIGDIWYAKEKIGTDQWAIPKDSLVTINAYLDPFSPGVGQTAEMTVCGLCPYLYRYRDRYGIWREMWITRALGYPESTWRLFFALKDTEEEPPPEEPPEEPPEGA